MRIKDVFNLSEELFISLHDFLINFTNIFWITDNVKEECHDLLKLVISFLKKIFMAKLIKHMVFDCLKEVSISRVSHSKLCLNQLVFDDVDKSFLDVILIFKSTEFSI